MIITEKNKHHKKTIEFLKKNLIGSILICNEFDLSRKSENKTQIIISDIKPRKRNKPKSELSKPVKGFRDTRNDEYKIHCYEISTNKKRIMSWTINGINKLLIKNENKEIQVI